MAKFADYILHRLAEWGVHRIFGYRELHQWWQMISSAIPFESTLSGGDS